MRERDVTARTYKYTDYSPKEKGIIADASAVGPVATVGFYILQPIVRKTVPPFSLSVENVLALGAFTR